MRSRLLLCLLAICCVEMYTLLLLLIIAFVLPLAWNETYFRVNPVPVALTIVPPLLILTSLPLHAPVRCSPQLPLASEIPIRDRRHLLESLAAALRTRT